MIGQEKLVAKLKSYSITTLPHSLLLVGESGCGKHTLAKELAEYFSLDLIDITESLSQDLLNEIKLKATPAMYLVSISDITEKEENMLLKFVEEPSIYAYIVLLGESEYSMLETLVNRCVVYRFEKYKAEELTSFLGGVTDSADEIMAICDTPGQVRLLAGYYNALMSTCTSFTYKLSKAAFSNIITNVINKINYKDEYDKWDFNLFLKMLKRRLMLNYQDTKDPLIYEVYMIVLEETDKLSDNRLDKRAFIEHLLSRLWLKVRGY